jgi:hypothetical protein
MDFLKLSEDFVPDPVPGYESVTNKLINVVVAIENLTPGVVFFRNLHSGERFPLRPFFCGPYGLQTARGDHVLIGYDSHHGRIGIRVNMARDMLRRIEFVTARSYVTWQPYSLPGYIGYVDLLLPRQLIDRVFPSRMTVRR